MAVSLQDLIKLGLLNYWTGYTNLRGYFRNTHLPIQIVSISNEIIQGFHTITHAYGVRFEILMVITLVCLTKRSANLWTHVPQEDIETILGVLGRERIPDWSHLQGVMTNFYDVEYEDNRQIFRLMSALQSYCYGKGARNRNRNHKIRDL